MMTAKDFEKLANEQECRWHDLPQPQCGDCLECKTEKALRAAADLRARVEQALAYSRESSLKGHECTLKMAALLKGEKP